MRVIDSSLCVTIPLSGFLKQNACPRSENKCSRGNVVFLFAALTYMVLMTAEGRKGLPVSVVRPYRAWDE